MFTTSSRNTLANNGLTKEGKYISLGGEITGSSEIYLTDNSALLVEGFKINKKQILLGSGFNGIVGKVMLYDTGRALVTGNFSSFNGTPVNYIARILYESGELDTTFVKTNGFNASAPSDFDIFSDGKIIAVFDETITLGISPDQKSYNTLVKLNANGTVDTSFNGTSTGLDFAPNFVKVLDDDKFIVYGSFQSYSGVTVNTFIQRFNNDGTIDTTFNSGFVGIDAGTTIYSIAIQPSDGKIVAVGDIQSYDGNAFGQIMRLNADGTFDGTFASGTGFDAPPDEIQVLSDDTLLVRGSFTDYDGTPVNGFVKLNADGTIDSAFLANLSGLTVNAFKVDDQNNILVSNISTVRRLNYDGTIDTSFPTRSVGGINYMEAVTADYNIFVGNILEYDLIPQSKFVLTDYTGSSLTASANITVDTPIQSPSSPINGNSLVTKESVGGLIEGSNGITKVFYDNLTPQTSLELGGAIPKDTDLISESSLRIVGNGIVVGGIGNDDLTLEYNKKFSALYSVNSITVLNTDIYAVGIGGFFQKYDSTGKRDNGFFGNGLTDSLAINNIAHDGTNLYIGGMFTTYNDKQKSRIVKVTPTGAISSTFDVGFGFNAPVNKIHYDSSLNKLYVGGLFTQFNNATQNRLVRLNSDGSKDTTFNIGTGFQSTVFDFQVQADGKIIVGGQFTQFTGATNNRLIRLLSNGKKDTTFNIGTGFAGGIASVRTIAIQTGDSKIIVGGSYTTFTGTSQNRIIRLNSNGTKDATFAVGGGFDNSVNSIVVQPDGKVLIGGSFSSYNGTPVNRIIRVNSNGSLDSSFNNLAPYGLIGNVFNIHLQSDGKIIVGGAMTNYSGQTVANLVRLNSDGTLEDDEYSNKLLVNNGVLEYSEDNSASYNNRSIVDKEYVDNIIASSGATANNGLTKTGSNIYLGGLLTGTTALVWTGGTTENTITMGEFDAFEVDANDASFGTSNLKIRPNDVYAYHDNQSDRFDELRISESGVVATSNFNFGDYASLSVQTPFSNVPQVRIFTLDSETFSNNYATFQKSGFTFNVQDPTNADVSVFRMTSGSTDLYDVNSLKVRSVNSSVDLNPDYLEIKHTDRSLITSTNKIGEINDTFFTGEKGFSQNTRAFAVQPDGKIIAAGSFTTYGEVHAPQIIRLNVDGTVDTTFNGVTTGFNGESSFKTAIAVNTGNSKIYVGSVFDTYNGSPASNFVSINSDGSFDTMFTGMTSGFNNGVHAIKVLSNGKILVAGSFSSYNGVSRGRIVRLNADGSFDTTFSGMSSGFNNTVYDLAVQPDGKIVAVGNFATYNGTSRVRVARLNTDGSLDTTFSGITTGLGNIGYSVSLQSTGKILVSGTFTTYNGSTANRIVRINTNGSIDTSFTGATTAFGAGAGVTVYEVRVQPDNKILMSGNFVSYNGTTANKIVRATANGAFDTTFSGVTTGFDREATHMVLQSDGKIIVGGNSNAYNDNIAQKIVRLNSNGTNDGTFTQNSFGFNNGIESITNIDGKLYFVGNFSTYYGVARNRVVRTDTNYNIDLTFSGATTGVNNIPYGIEEQSTNKLILFGTFTTYNGSSYGRIVRLNLNGSIDTGFTGHTTGFASSVNAIAVQPDDKIVAIGNFTTYNGTTRNRIARLTANGALDATFSGLTTGFNSQAHDLIRLSNGKLLVSGEFATYNGTNVGRLVRLNSNGTIDSTFSGKTTGFDNSVFAMRMQSDGKLVLGGRFTTYNGITANSIIRLNADGSRDTTFSGVTDGFDDEPDFLYILPSGKIIVGGFYSTYNNEPVNYVVRLNSDGTLDRSFNWNEGYQSNDIPQGIYQLSDTQFIAYGYENSYGNNTIGFNAILEDYVDLVVTNDKSMKYADDYSENFTDRSLVDKAYVDGIIASSGATAANGLTKSGNVIRLGGNLTGNTTIGGAFDLALNGVKAFEIDIVDGSDATYAYINGNGVDLGAADNSFINLGTLSLQQGYVSIGASFSGGGIIGEMMTTPTPQFRFAATGGLVSTFRGLTYFANYSANFTARSLVDKGYVTGLTSQNSKSSLGITGNGVTTLFTFTHNKNTRDVIVQVYQNFSPWGTVIVDTERSSVNAVDIRFAVAPANGEIYRVVII